MKTSKRIITWLAATILILCLTVGMAACGDTYRISMFGDQYDVTIGGKKSTENGNSGGATQSAEEDTSQSGTSDSATASEQGSSSGGGQTQPVVDNADLISYSAASESVYVIWKETSVGSAQAWYKKSGAASYTKVDGELIRKTEDGKARVDILGLAAGNYDVKIDVGSSEKDIVIENIAVTAYDRSGYAHFNYSAGVGAYKDDGTLKDGAIVVYVSENNKNTVKANGATGIADIIKSAKNKPIAVRLIGRVTSDTKISADKYEGKYELIDGLTEKENSGDGSLWGQLSAEGVRNVTLEGIGDDAELFQWGVTFKRCSSIEVRNLTFTDYPEDACGIDGGSNEEMNSYGYFWVHNNVFNIGKRLFDDTDEHDKGEGDGAIDIKFCHNATYSYNVVKNCHKTGLVGGSDGNMQCNITFHHNYFLKNQSRMPLGRQANLHYYNNYFSGTTNTTMDLRANAYALSECNYFEKCKNPVKTSGGAAVKSYNDVFASCSGTNEATVVTDRTAKVSNSCSFGNAFDTDAGKFYYNTVKKASLVTYMSTAEQAKTDCLNLAGPCKANRLG